MILDPFSALSAAAAIMQFVNFTGQLVANCYRLSGAANGALSENLDLEATTADCHGRD